MWTYSLNRRAIVPIGVMFSLTLICGNLAYLTLSVSFIQMLKVCTTILVSQPHVTDYSPFRLQPRLLYSWPPGLFVSHHPT